jgi:UDP-N-acetylmuramate dehydrogenase
VFQNPDPARDQLPDGVPWSAGALVDRAGLKGAKVGGAVISVTHGNFIVADETATARDIRTLIERARESVSRQFGVQLRDEIVYLGEW